MDHTQSHFDLLDALKETGCPMCRLSLAAVVRWMNAVDYESVGDPGLRAQLRAANGFCNWHAHQWLARAHVLGTAQIYQDILAGLTDELRGLHRGRAPVFAGLASLLGPSLDRQSLAGIEPASCCPACQVLANSESILADTIVDGLAEEQFREAYLTSTGLCLPHLKLALERVDEESLFAELRNAAVAKQEGLIAELAEVIRRHDYRFADEPWGTERDAVARAVEQIIGTPGIVDRHDMNERGGQHAGRRP